MVYFDGGKGRHVVLLDEDGSQIALRSANLRKLEQAATVGGIDPAVAARARRAIVQAVKVGDAQCTHELVQYFGGKLSCACCWEPITGAERLAAEMKKMQAALTEDHIDEDHAHSLWSRGVSVAWLLGFTKRHRCWGWTTAEVQALIIKPATNAGRQRYADLLDVRAVAGVGPADVFVSRESVFFLPRLPLVSPSTR